MDQQSVPQVIVGCDTGLRFTLERLLERAMGRPVRIGNLKREPSPFSTLFPAEVLSLEFEDGGKTSLFLKHLGPEQSEHPEKQCRDREIRIYEELLTDGDLPVVKYYGSRWNEASRRREVYLEYINDWNLKYHGLEHWFTAARRLADLHAHFATRAENLSACGFLLRFDGVYLCEWSNRALSVLADLSAKLAAELQYVVARYDRVVDVLARQPSTLVHNDLSPKNVIADRSASPARICFVDWEMAGVGCGLLDLVHLKYGLDPESDQKMCAAYFKALEGSGLLPSSRREAESLFAACELHKTLYRVAFSKIWQVPVERVARWVGEARRFFDRISGFRP